MNTGRLKVDWLDDARGVVLQEDRRCHFTAVVDGTRVWVRWRGRTYRVDAVSTERDGATANAEEARQATAPMPGIVLSMNVSPGDLVAQGDVLFSLEAMKMEHQVRAAVAGRVLRVRAQAGTRVEAGSVLVELGPGATPSSDDGNGAGR